MSSTNLKINAWVLALQEFDYQIYHVPGWQNIVADVLSRVPRDLLVQMDEEEMRACREYHEEKDVWVRVQQEKEIKYLMSHFHDEPYSGHYAAEIAYRWIYENFYWPSMYKYLYNYFLVMINANVHEISQSLRRNPYNPSNV
ncbi:hypothetical protein RUND412_010561 [Rhizina undulata]